MWIGMSEREYYEEIDMLTKRGEMMAEQGLNEDGTPLFPEEGLPTLDEADMADYAIWEYEDSYRDMLWMEGEDLK